MKRKKKLTLLWREFNSLELGKDVMLIPYYLGKSLNYDVEICMNYTDEQANEVAKYIKRTDATIVKKTIGYTPYRRISAYFKYLLVNARKTDLLMCFHWRVETYFCILLYKLLNPKGKIYIKLDTDSGNEFDTNRHKGIKRWFLHKLYSVCIRRVNCFSCETSKVYDTICQNKEFGDIIKKKLVLMPNGFDEELLQSFNIKERSFAEKENLIITVGRIGTEQKNTEMLLNALQGLDLKDWKVCLIGPIEPKFQKTIDKFYQQHPEKHNQVQFVGSISDKLQLWEWYNRAKVFVLTSNYESYGIVLTEAKRFNNYIISTPVGAAYDIIGNETNGSIIAPSNFNELSETLQSIINEKVILNNNSITTELTWENIIKNISTFITTNQNPLHISI